MPFWVASVWSLTRSRSPARGQLRIYPRENGGAGVSLRKARAQEAAHSGRRNQGLTIVHTERADRQRRHTVPRVWRIRRRRRKEAPGQPLFERPWGIVAGSRMELSIPQIAEPAMRSSVTALPPLTPAKSSSVARFLPPQLQTTGRKKHAVPYRYRPVRLGQMISRKLLFGLLVAFMAAAVGVALWSSETSWGFLTATRSDSVFCSSGLSAETASASTSRTLPSCPTAVTRS